jgi:hypothetical protein
MSEWTEIATANSPSGGEFVFSSLTLTGVVQLLVVCSQVTVTTDGTYMKLGLYIGGSLITSGYRSSQGQIITSGLANTDANNTSAIWLHSDDSGTWNVGNASGESFGGLIWIDSPLSTAFNKTVRFQTCHITQAVQRSSGCAGGGCLDNTGALEGFKLFGDSALTAGKVRVLARS